MDIRMEWTEWFRRTLQRIRDNDPQITVLDQADIHIDDIRDMTDDKWEQLGHDIANNTHLKRVNLSGTLDLTYATLNDHRMSFFFRRLTRSSSLKRMVLQCNGLSVAGVQCMVPFLQNSNNLKYLDLSDNNLRAEGFNFLFRALSNSRIEELFCRYCRIESIEIDSENKPKHLKKLLLDYNNINADGCRGLARLLRGGDATLTTLHLPGNMIDDEGVGVLVDSLQNNTSLRELYLQENDGISKQGKVMLLKLVNDISSINATLQSNHTLRNIIFTSDPDEQIQRCIIMATEINNVMGNRLEAGTVKVIQMQLDSVERAELAEIQGVTSSLYSEIDPLHLPEVLSLVGRHHGQGELYVALKSSIAGVISTVNRKECLKLRIAEQRAIIIQCRNKIEAAEADIEAAEAEIKAFEAMEVHVMDAVSASRRNKRRRS